MVSGRATTEPEMEAVCHSAKRFLVFIGVPLFIVGLAIAQAQQS
jgi:hypothetical protein